MLFQPQRWITVVRDGEWLAMAPLEMPYQHLPTDTTKNHKRPNQINQYLQLGTSRIQVWSITAIHTYVQLQTNVLCLTLQYFGLSYHITYKPTLCPKPECHNLNFHC